MQSSNQRIPRCGVERLIAGVSKLVYLESRLWPQDNPGLVGKPDFRTRILLGKNLVCREQVFLPGHRYYLRITDYFRETPGNFNAAHDRCVCFGGGLGFGLRFWRGSYFGCGIGGRFDCIRVYRQREDGTGDQFVGIAIFEGVRV